MNWKDDMLLREYERFAPADAVRELNRAVLHEPEPAPMIQPSDELVCLRARNAFLQGAAENWANEAREYYRRYKLWRGSFFVACAWAVSLAVALIWRMA